MSDFSNLGVPWLLTTSPLSVQKRPGCLRKFTVIFATRFSVRVDAGERKPSSRYLQAEGIAAMIQGIFAAIQETFRSEPERNSDAGRPERRFCHQPGCRVPRSSGTDFLSEQCFGRSGLFRKVRSCPGKGLLCTGKLAIELPRGRRAWKRWDVHTTEVLTKRPFDCGSKSENGSALWAEGDMRRVGRSPLRGTFPVQSG